MPETSAEDERLEHWLAVVRRENLRHIDRTMRESRSGPLAIPLRFVYKVLALGPVAASKLAMAVIAERVGLR